MRDSPFGLLRSRLPSVGPCQPPHPNEDAAPHLVVVPHRTDVGSRRHDRPLTTVGVVLVKAR
jgi:hypothetical protein